LENDTHSEVDFNNSTSTRRLEVTATQVFKELLTNFFPDFIELFLPDVSS
jgi:hypothetical protein